MDLLETVVFDMEAVTTVERFLASESLGEWDEIALKVK
jgi:hypothetical protein